MIYMESMTEDEMPNRTLCDVLSDMRKCFKTYNFSILKSLIEEAQIMGNRMEAGLWDQHDVERLRKERSELKKEIKTLRQDVEKLKKEKTND